MGEEELNPQECQWLEGRRYHDVQSYLLPNDIDDVESGCVVFCFCVCVYVSLFMVTPKKTTAPKNTKKKKPTMSLTKKKSSSISSTSIHGGVSLGYSSK
ncbi:hypothetical protein K457DRAFT_442767 [Linnemannia elongata AG-77]|uniref:Uncharacterized protein n=1 Tax=Linnemannia elongata AG-77 TaxID=1314771 RepID=A0A197JZI2_9FUNG|nr:hypothetical protein K457DRAFT_442767 [Linnemannia elongata AG-77]